MKINYTKLKEYCTNEIESFSKYGNVTETHDGILISSIKAENKILAVAHLDYVANNDSFVVEEALKDTLVFNGSLDDRLGVYAIVDLLPKYGLNYDILLTEGEEVGMSTAMHFESDKSYNWMFSFDRKAENVVMYQYDNDESRDLLNRHGFNVDIGSFSDIAFLDNLGCIGFNFGVGYYNEHSRNHYASMTVFKNQMEKFIKFFNANKNIKMPYDNSNYISYLYDDYPYDDDYYFGDIYETRCESCDFEYAEVYARHLKDGVIYALCGDCFYACAESGSYEEV